MSVSVQKNLLLDISSKISQSEFCLGSLEYDDDLSKALDYVNSLKGELEDLFRTHPHSEQQRESLAMKLMAFGITGTIDNCGWVGQLNSCQEVQGYV